jgi:hypothetical protein
MEYKISSEKEGKISLEEDNKLDDLFKKGFTSLFAVKKDVNQVFSHFFLNFASLLFSFHSKIRWQWTKRSLRRFFVENQVNYH